MAFRLVIAEKPSVAQTIAAALGIKGKQDGYIEGGGYLISWCVGHLVQLAEAAAYGEQYKKWSFDSLPILPEEWQYAVDPDKGKQFKTIKELMHRADVSEVVNACDAGREGELIFRFVYEAAGCKKPMRRLWISSMEDGAIKAGFASLKDGRDYGALFASALCRAKADWLIGINATRLFSCLYGKTLNVGRVQTPTLKMLTDRDAAISHFQKEKYYHVRLDLSGADAASERISDKAEADALKGACEAGKAVCVSLTREKKTAAPKEAFTPETIYKMRRNPYGDSPENSHLLQAYVTQENGRAKMGDVLYTGTPEKCRELMGQLKSGELTEGDVKQLYAKAQETAQTAGQDKDTFSIYQIKGGDETRDFRFEPYDRLQAAGNVVDRANYELVYSAPLAPETSLEDIYTRFNIDHPKDFKGHSLSVSDVVVLHQNGQDTAHYVDSFGYKKVPEFLQPENYLKTAEQTTEQNYNMIDGQINNTPTVAELEAKVKTGETISLVDLAETVKADKERGKAAKTEKKPSIRAQLKAAKEQTPKKQAKQKTQDLERS